MQTHLERAQVNFGTYPLGDKRRTVRLIQVTAEVAGSPSASCPDPMQTWSDLKAVYLRMDSEEVTFQAITQPYSELCKLSNVSPNAI